MRIAGLVCLLVVAAFADDRADALREGDWTQRNLLLDELAEEPAEIAVPLLIEALQLEDTFIAARAAQMLRLYGEGARPAVPALIQALYHESGDVSRRAYETLHWLGPIAAVAVPYMIETRPSGRLQVPIATPLPPYPRKRELRSSSYEQLVAILKQSDIPQRAAAARRLGSMRAGVVEAPLREAMADPAWEVRGAAAWALGQLGTEGPETLRTLFEALDDSSLYVRAKAVHALVANEAAVPYLRRALESGIPRKVRRVAAALARLRCPEALVPTLAGMLDSPARSTRLATLGALAHAGSAATMTLDRLLALLESDDAAQRSAVYAVLAQVGPSVGRCIPALIAAAERGGRDAESAVSLLGICGEGAHKALVAMLEEAPSRERELIMYALVRARRSTPLVLGALDRGDSDPQSSVREAARAARSRLPQRDTASGAELLDALRSKTSMQDVRPLCTRLLERGEECPDPATLLMDEAWQLRYFALFALSREEGYRPELIDQVTRARNDPNPHVKSIAPFALQRVLTPTAGQVPALVEQLNSDDPMQVRSAIDALRNAPSSGSGAIPRLMELARSGDGRQRAAAIGLLAKSGEPAVAPLIELMAESDSRIRSAARKALGRMKCEAVVPALLALREHRNTQLRLEAVRVLRSQSRIEELVAWLDDPAREVRTEVVRAFVGHRHVRSLPGLLRALELDEYEPTRLALIGLGRHPEEAKRIVPAIAPLLSHKNGMVRRMAGETVRGMGPAADPVTLDALASADADLRAAGVFGLRSDREDSEERLRSALQDEDERVRMAVVQRLPDWPDNEALLLEALGNDSDRVVRMLLRHLPLFRVLPGSATPILIGLAEANAGNRFHVCAALRRDLPHSVGIMLERAASKQTDALADTFRSLGKAAVPELVRALRNERLARRRSAIWALKSIGGDAADAIPALRELESDRRLRDAAYEAIARIRG